MATSVKARRTEISLWYNSTPVSDEIGPDVESLTYTDCASDTCDSVDIKVNARDEKWLNSWWPQQGATLHPKVTGLDWNLENDRWDMDCGLFVLDDVQYGDAPGRLSLGGVSKPAQTDFSEQERTDIWKNTSIQRIGATIAGRYGLGFAYDGDDHDIEKREQNESDSEFYQKLCKDYGLVLKVYANKLWVYDRERYKGKRAVQDVPRTAMKPGSFTYTETLAGTYTGGTFAYTDQDKDIDITASVGGGKRTKSLNQYASSVADAAAQLVAALNDANHGSRKISFTIGGNFIIFAGNNVRIEGFGPKIDGKYVAIIHPSVAYDLRSSDAWVEAHKYAGLTELFTGEIGELHGVRFIETTEAKIFNGEGCPVKTAADTSKGTPAEYYSVYATLFLGKDAYGMIDPEGGNLEMIIKDKGQVGGPLNQFSTLGYKFSSAAKILYQDRMVRVESCGAYSAEDEAN